MLLTTFGITSNNMKKILLTNLLVLVSWLALSQSQPIDPVYINTDSIASNTNNTDLKLVGRGTGLVNIEGAYTLPGVDGTSGYLISTNGAGVWGYTDPSSLQVTFGTDNQVPFVNAGGTDFDYSANLTFDGTTGTINNIQIAGSIITNNNAGSSTILSGGGANDGASVIFYDDTHATLANDILFRNNTSASAQYDHSASLWDFQNKAITTTGIGTFGSITLTTDLTVANGGTGASSFTDGGILYGNGTSAFSVTSAPAGADEFLVSTGAATWGLESASSARTSLGLGTMATQNATSVNIDGGTIDGTTIGGTTPAAGTFVSGVFEGTADERIRLIDSDAAGSPFISFFQATTRRSYVGYFDSGDVLRLASEYGGVTILTGTAGTPSDRGGVSSTGAWSTNGNTLSAGATTTTTMRNSSNAGTGDDIAYYDSDGDLTRSTIDIADVSTTVTGTFTPVIADASSGGNTGTATTIQGEYTKTGKMVTVTISFVNINTAGMTGGNDVKIRDLPFTIANNTNGPVGSVILANVAFSGYVSVLGGNGTTIMSLRESASGASGTNVTVADLTSGSADILCSITYTTSD